MSTNEELAEMKTRIKVLVNDLHPGLGSDQISLGSLPQLIKFVSWTETDSY